MTDHKIILGGNHISNKEWCIHMASKLSQYGLYTWQCYKHRDMTNGNIDIEYERKAIESMKKTENDNWVVIAKSIGCYLALDCIEHQNITIDTLVCVWLPLAFVREEYGFEFWEKFKKLSIKNAYFINQDNDPQSGIQEIIPYVYESGISNKERVYIYPGNTHSYDPTLIEKVLLWRGILAYTEQY